MITRRRFVLASGAILSGSACRAGALQSQASLLDYIPAAWHADILQRGRIHDVAEHVQRGIDESARAGAELIVPAGRYWLAPRRALAHADPHFVCEAAMLLRSSLRLRARQGATFVMLPGISSDAAPRAMAMFGTSDVLTDVQIDGLTMDMNAAANPISAQRREGNYVRTPQAHFFVSGGAGNGAARIDRCGITRCQLTGSAGVSCIVAGQTNGVPGVLGRDWVLAENRFSENGYDTDDHSSVYGMADAMVVRDNVFENSRPFNGTGGNTAFEVHGSGHVLERNTVRNYVRGIWIGSGFQHDVVGTRISNNKFQTLFFGIDFFRDEARLGLIRDTVINDNQFFFDDQSVAGLDLKAAVQIASPYAQSRIEVRDNIVEKKGTAIASAFLVIAQGQQGSDIHDQITAVANRGTGLTCGIFVRTTPKSGIGTLTFLENRWDRMAPAGIFSIAAGCALEYTGVVQPVRSLTIGGGSCSGTGKDSYALSVNTLVQTLTLRPITVTGVGSALRMGGAGRIGRTTGTIAVKR